MSVIKYTHGDFFSCKIGYNEYKFYDRKLYYIRKNI